MHYLLPIIPAEKNKNATNLVVKLLSSSDYPKNKLTQTINAIRALKCISRKSLSQRESMAALINSLGFASEGSFSIVQGQFISRHTRQNEMCKFQTVIYTFD